MPIVVNEHLLKLKDNLVHVKAFSSDGDTFKVDKSLDGTPYCFSHLVGKHRGF